MDTGILTTIVTALVGAITGAVAALLANFLATRTRIDEKLRDNRDKEYKVLWEMTKILSKWPRPTGLKYEDLALLTQSLMDWYFSRGGIYLSRQSREAYGEVQEQLERVLIGRSETELADPLTFEEYEVIREKCSALRTQLTEDLLSRSRIFLVS